MKKQINEVKRMQLIAGLITESEYRESSMNEVSSKTFTPKEVKAILLKHGVDKEFLEDNDNYIEGGNEPWMSILSDITGKDAYEDNFTDKDDKIIQNFMDTMESMGIEVA
jgi:hypothetical protein